MCAREPYILTFVSLRNETSQSLYAWDSWTDPSAISLEGIPRQQRRFVANRETHDRVSRFYKWERLFAVSGVSDLSSERWSWAWKLIAVFYVKIVIMRYRVKL